MVQMDFKEIQQEKEKLKNEIGEKINDLFELEKQEYYLNSNESGFYMYFKKNFLECLNFDFKNNIKTFQKENKKLPIEFLNLGDHIILRRKPNDK